MIPSKVAYHKPNTLDEAIGLLQEYGDECKLLAGGHSLIPVMKLRLADPENLIDISGLEELRVIRDNEKSITIGSATTHGEIASSAAIQEHIPMMAQAAHLIGDIQVRNFGTIGGSIAHADPAADWPAVLLAANAQIQIVGPNGDRQVDIDQFFHGLYMTAVGEDEIIKAISIPKTAANRNSCYRKFPQPASRFALVACAAAVEVHSKQVKDARVAFAGVSATPFRDTNIEKALEGSPWSASTVANATATAAEGVQVLSDHFANEKYRRHLAGVFAGKALNALL